MAQLSLWKGNTPADFLLALPLTCEFTAPAIDYDWKYKQVSGTSSFLRTGTGLMLHTQSPLRIKVHGINPADTAQQINQIRAALLQTKRLYDGTAEWWEINSIKGESQPKYGFARLSCEITFVLQLQKQLVQFNDPGSGQTENRLPLGDTGGI